MYIIIHITYRGSGPSEARLQALVASAPRRTV